MSRLISSLALASLVATPGLAMAYDRVFTFEHIDVVFKYEDGEWEAKTENDDPIGPGDDLYDSADTLIFGADFNGAAPGLSNSVSAGLAQAFGLTQGAPIYIFPQERAAGIPWPGLEVEVEDSPSPFVTDPVSGETTFTVGLADVRGPGDLYYYSEDSFGSIVSYFDSVGDSFATSGDHGHFNWAFTQPGFYEVDLTISAPLAAGGVAVGRGTWNFQVIPEPATLSLLGAGAALALRRRVR